MADFNLFIDVDRVIGILFRAVISRQSVFYFHKNEILGDEMEWYFILEEDPPLLTITTTLTANTSRFVRSLVSDLRKKADNLVYSAADADAIRNVLGKLDAIKDTAGYLQRKYGLTKDISEDDLVQISLVSPEIEESMLVRIEFTPDQLKQTEEFLKSYAEKYMNKALAGQGKAELPDNYITPILTKINSPDFIPKYGHQNLHIDGNGVKFFFHSLLLLWYKEQIKIHTLAVQNKNIMAVIDNLSLGQISVTPKKLPTDVEWEESPDKYTLKFPDGKKLVFKSLRKPSAKYFKLLMDHHGYPIRHELAQRIIGVPTATDIRNLAKTLTGKIGENMLSARVKITSQKEAAYTLNITPAK